MIYNLPEAVCLATSFFPLALYLTETSMDLGDRTNLAGRWRKGAVLEPSQMESKLLLTSLFLRPCLLYIPLGW